MASYPGKRERHRALLASMIPGVEVGGATPGFDGGARGEKPPSPPPWGVNRGPEPVPSERGWRTFEIEDGASLFFPWIEDERR
jgi:hypothetical protein